MFNYLENISIFGKIVFCSNQMITKHVYFNLYYFLFYYFAYVMNQSIIFEQTTCTYRTFERSCNLRPQIPCLQGCLDKVWLQLGTVLYRKW